ncbi:T-complex protein 1 subunit delta [Raphanus sativus]|nr:T-complex protein 1 subunit delta [Raphanus sativus]
MYASRPSLQKSNCSKAIYSDEPWIRNGSGREKVKFKAVSCSISGRWLLSTSIHTRDLNILKYIKEDAERDEIEFVTKILNCLPIANIEHFKAENLGHADLVEEASLGDVKILKIIGIDRGRTTSVLVRGSNQLVLDEAERSLHDAL